MLGKSFGFRKKTQQDAVKMGAATERTFKAPLGDVAKMLNASGRIGLSTLQKLADVYDKTDFIRFIQQPVLAGSSIQAGSLSAQSRTGSAEMNRTVIFEMDMAEDAASSSESLQHAIYPLVKSESASGTRTVFRLGRIADNDMSMADFAISKQHAILEIRGDNYFIRDCGSTNGTMLNGKTVGEKPVQIRDGDIIGFARYEFSFLFPESLFEMLISQ